MGGADAVGHRDLSFVTARVLELHVAGAGVHTGCGGDFACGVGGDDEGVAGLKEGPHPSRAGARSTFSRKREK